MSTERGVHCLFQISYTRLALKCTDRYHKDYSINPRFDEPCSSLISFDVK
jgi:hypothetical protein